MDKYQISATAQFKYTKHERNFTNSIYSGITLYPIVLTLYFIYCPTLINIICMTITAALYYNNKYKWRYVIKAIFQVSLITAQHSYQGQVCSFITNLVLVTNWPLQLVFQITMVWKQNQIFMFFCLITLSRTIEILKRQLYAKICNINSHQREQERLFLNLPHHILYMDENQTSLYCNKKHTFTLDSQKIISDAILRKQTGVIQLETSDKYTLEYHFRPWQGNFIMVQSEFQTEKEGLFLEQHDQITKLYVQLCTDYAKWNNLRAFKMITESDLSLLGQCLSECLELDYQNQTLIDTHTTELSQFFLKITLCNLVEATLLKLYEHFAVINLEFENGIPEVVAGDKKLLIYILQTLLYSTSFCDKQKGELSLRCIIAQVNQEKSGYDLEFSLFFTCTPSVIRLYSQVFGHQDNKLSPNETIFIHALQKCKQLMKLSHNQFNFKTDGDSVSITFTFLSLICSNKPEIIPQNTDITFSRTVLDDCHYQWKERVLVAPTKFNLDPKKSIPIEQQHIPQEIENIVVQYPEIRDEIISIFECLLEHAYSKGLLEKVFIDHNNLSVKCAISEYADSVANSPPSFITPQIKPRKLQDMAKEKFKNLLKEAKKPKKKKKVIKKDDPYRVVFPKRNDQFADTKNGLSICFSPEVLTNRKQRPPMKWSHRCKVTKQPVVVSEILCYVPNVKMSKEIIRNFGNFKYDKFEIKEPLIVCDMANVTKIYKDYLEEGKQFYFIMLFVKKPQEIADFAETVKRNEAELAQIYPKLQQSYLIGIMESQLKLSLYAYLKYIIPYGQWSTDIKQIKAYIVAQRDNK